MKRSYLPILFALIFLAVSLFGCQVFDDGSPKARPGSIPPDTAGRYVFEGTYFTVLDIFTDGTYYFNDNRVDYFSGGFVTKVGDVFTFSETFGPCANQTGKYSMVEKGNGFTWVGIEDNCTSRIDLYANLIYVKVPKEYPYVQFLWKTLTQKTNFIVTDSNDNIYVTDGGKGFHEFSADGKILNSWDGLNDSYGIAISKSGNIYIVDKADLSINKFDPNGKLILKWNIESNKFGPGDIAVDDQENVYVALQNSQLKYVEKYDSDGVFIGSWASHGSGDGEVLSKGNIGPVEIVATGAGIHYITDPLNNRVVKFDADGNFLANITGDGTYELSSPRFLALDKDENLFVLDESQSIWKFDAKDQYVKRWFTPSWGSIAVDKAGNVVIADFMEVVKVKLP